MDNLFLICRSMFTSKPLSEFMAANSSRVLASGHTRNCSTLILWGIISN